MLYHHIVHFLKQVGSEYEVRQALVGRFHDVGRDTLPLLVSLVDKEDVLANAHYGVHVVGIDNGCHAELLGQAV